MGLFIFHFTYSIFTIFNNILSGIFIEKINAPGLNDFSHWYIENLVSHTCFYEKIAILLLVLSLGGTVWFFKRKTNYSNSASWPKNNST